MKQFLIRPEICSAKSCDEFFGQAKINSHDLVITDDHIYNGCLKKYFSQSTVVFVSNYGKGEPTDIMADRISEDIGDKRYDRIFGVGGGTVLDISKLFALEKHYPICPLFTGEIPCKKEKQLILIPTTCGTGSELTNISILELTTLGTKKGLADKALYADKAVLIPELLKSLPYQVYAASSADAVVHAVESFLSPKASEYSKMFSVYALKKLIKAYKHIAEHGKQSYVDTLEDTLTASSFAGAAFSNAGCAQVHAMSYPLGAACHICHGMSNYIMFGAVMRKYAEKGGSESYTELSEILCKELCCSQDEAFEELDMLMGKILKRKPLSSFGLGCHELTEFADSVEKNQQRLIANNPLPLTKDDMLEIYLELE